MKTVEDIIEALKSNEKVIDAVETLAAKVHVQNFLKLDEYEGKFDFQGNYVFDHDRPLFILDEEFGTLVDLIEDICDMSVGVYLHSNDWYEQEENIGAGIDSDTTFAAYIAQEITDDYMLKEGHLYQGALYFYPRENDIYELEGRAQLEKEFKYALIDSNEIDYVPLSNFETADGNHTKDFSLEDAESAYRYYLNRNLYDDWEYDKDTDCLFRKETEDEED